MKPNHLTCKKCKFTYMHMLFACVLKVGLFDEPKKSYDNHETSITTLNKTKVSYIIDREGHTSESLFIVAAAKAP